MLVFRLQIECSCGAMLSTPDIVLQLHQIRSLNSYTGISSSELYYPVSQPESNLYEVYHLKSINPVIVSTIYYWYMLIFISDDLQ